VVHPFQIHFIALLCINNSLFHLTAISPKTQELQDINPAAAFVYHAFAI